MTTPTHNEISLQAHQLWQSRACPSGCDTEIWLEAERNLNEDQAFGAFISRAGSEAPEESEVEYHLSPAQTEQKSIQSETQKKSARDPQVPHHTGPKSMPAETGKPLWSRPHSS